MALLPSQLEENVADGEELARFLLSSSLYNNAGVKPGTFLPNPKDREASVFRHGPEPRERLWEIGSAVEGEGRKLHGAAFILTGMVRAEKLDVIAEEPPPRHAAIRGWPWDEEDPERLKARHKELALKLASKATLIRR